MSVFLKLVRNPIIHIWPIALVLFSGGEILARRNIFLEGNITARKVEKNRFNPYRDGIIYTVVDRFGRTQSYEADSNDHSLSTELRVGDEIEKKRATLGYKVNGIYTLDFPIGFYGVLFSVGSVGFLASMFYWWRRLKVKT